MDRKHIIHQDRAPIIVTWMIEEDCRLRPVQVNSILTSTVVRDGVSLEQKKITLKKMTSVFRWTLSIPITEEQK